MKLKPLTEKFRFVLIISFLFFLNCAHTGMITEEYPPDFYKIPNLLPQGPLESNSKFIVYSDNQAGWRIREKFLKKKNWYTWKMILFPFYELYWIGNGFIGGINGLRYVPDYGKSERLMMRDVIYAEAKRSGVEFILNVGDMVAHDGRRPAHWATFLKENKQEHPLLTEIPYLPVIGNHERANDSTFGFSNYHAVFQYPRFYVVEFEDAALYVLDSNFIIDQNQHIDDDLQDELFKQWFVSDGEGENSAWLEHELAARDVSFKMVAMHHPPISYGKHHSDWANLSCGRNLIGKCQRLLDLFQRQGVNVVFSGHDHLYQHNLLRIHNNEDGVGRDIHFIVGGGGGVPLRDVTDKKTMAKYQQNFSDMGVDVLSVKMGKFYHYFLVNVTSDTLTIQVFGVSKEKSHPITLKDEILIPRG